MERGDDSKSNKNETYLLCFGDNIQPTKKKKKRRLCHEHIHGQRFHLVYTYSQNEWKNVGK